jgi:hypothetical protein
MALEWGLRIGVRGNDDSRRVRAELNPSSWCAAEGTRRAPVFPASLASPSCEERNDAGRSVWSLGQRSTSVVSIATSSAGPAGQDHHQPAGRLCPVDGPRIGEQLPSDAIPGSV